MGNESSSKKSKSKQNLATELTDINYADECAEEEYIDKTNCCWLEFQAVKKRKIIWENNFITHCMQTKEEFRWAQEMIELIAVNLRPKSVFFKQVNDLKQEIIVASENNERDVLATPSEVEQFKNNLKKSVILSTSYANKYSHENGHKASNTGTLGLRPSKIQFNRFRNSNPRRNTSSSKKIDRSNSMSSSKSGLRKSIMSFMDDTLSSVFGAQREISKQVANNLQVFLKFTMLIEKHFSDPQCMLSVIKRKFIQYVLRNYSDPIASSEKIEEFVDSINQFMTILKQAVIDYYNLNSFAEGQFSNPFIANEENILSLCRTIFFKDKPFYETVFNAVIKYNAVRETQFQRILKLLQSEQPDKFYVKQKFCLNEKTLKQALQTDVIVKDSIIEREPYRQCILVLNQLQKSMTPINKMKIILLCSQTMNKEIQKFYDVNGLHRQKWVLDADQVLAIFCYIIVNAKIAHMHSHLFMLDHFSTSSQMISVFGYYLSVMNCAVQQLQSDYAEKAKEQLIKESIKM